jgi:hypothetical protein
MLSAGRHWPIRLDTPCQAKWAQACFVYDVNNPHDNFLFCR